jgi:hypothetical protein
MTATLGYELDPLVATLCFIGLIIIGLFFYWLRRNFQCAYGICELIVALTVFYLVLYPASYAITNGDVLFISMWLGRFYGILIGVYLFVRGMDNVSNGSSRMRSRFDCIFAKIPFWS